MSAVDHAALADKHAEESIAANRNGNWETSRMEMSLARFHGERALVEQQRIANLIAYTVKLSSHPTNIGEMHATDVADFHASVDIIREGLGLR